MSAYRRPAPLTLLVHAGLHKAVGYGVRWWHKYDGYGGHVYNTGFSAQLSG